MKYAFASALLVASATAFSPEFMQGCQTGVFLADEQSFKDYSCPSPTLDPSAKMWIDMIVPMKSMMEGMNEGKPVPAMETLTHVTKQLSIVYSLFWSEYDGGDFCQGLIFSKEVSAVFWTFGKEAVSSFMDSGEEHKAVAAYLQK